MMERISGDYIVKDVVPEFVLEATEQEIEEEVKRPSDEPPPSTEEAPKKDGE